MIEANYTDFKMDGNFYPNTISYIATYRVGQYSIFLVEHCNTILQENRKLKQVYWAGN